MDHFKFTVEDRTGTNSWVTADAVLLSLNRLVDIINKQGDRIAALETEDLATRIANLEQ